MAPPSLSTSPRRLSSSFINGAISTAASPLQASFNLSCRSPVRPSHEADPRRSLNGISARFSSSQYLQPPSFFPLISTEAVGSKVVHEDACGDACDAGNDGKPSLSSDDSPTDQTWFLQPQTPGPAEGWVRQDEEGKLGVFSAINIIVGKTVGVGAYSVPSAIFAGVGSVGMTLLLWVVGSLISFCGLAVYLDLGTAIPRSGGERVYLERIFRRPRMLATCMFMAYVVLLGFSAPNAIVLGEYALYALDISPNRWNVRAIAVCAVSVLCWIHARHPRLGLRLLNVLSIVKMLILVVVVLAGIAGGMMGVGAERELSIAERRLDIDLSSSQPRSTAQRNFSDIWAGTSTQPYDYATALLKVIYCFRGYSTANQVLSDVKDPVRTLKIAAPIALTLVSLAYLAINIAFFLVVDKDDFRSAGVVVAGVFFTNIFGPGVGAHVLPVFVIISAAGNIAATSFAQARVNEELAKDGLLPWSRFWTSSPPPPTRPPGYAPRSSSPTKNRSRASYAPPSSTPTPSRGLLLHWLVSAAVILLPPPGRIYNFLVNIGGYPVSVISVAVSAGLFYLQRTSSSSPPSSSADQQKWSSPAPAPQIAVVVFALSNCVLLVLPWIPPAGGRGEDGRFASYAYPATALGVLACGAGWWCWWRLRGNGRYGSGGRLRVDGSETLWSVEDEMKDGDGGPARGLLSRDEEGEGSVVP